MSTTAETLIRDLAERGVRLTRNADRLRVEAPLGAVTLELREVLAERKRDLLFALAVSTPRERLLTLADAERIDRHHVLALPASDVDACAELPDATLRGYLRAL